MLKPTDENTVYVYAPRDPSVGISPREAEIVIEGLEYLVEDIPEIEEYLRERFTETFGTVFDDGRVEVQMPGDGEEEMV
jgi:translation initiation factor 1 (eIF-1/SUI1)